MCYLNDEFYKVVSNNESLPDMFETFSRAYDALKVWNKDYGEIHHCKGHDLSVIYTTEWEDNDEL